MKMESEITYAEMKFPGGSNQKEEKKTGAKKDVQAEAEKKQSPKILIALLLVIVLLLAGLVALIALYFQASSRVQELEQQMAQLQPNKTKVLEYIGCKNRYSAHNCSKFFSWACPTDWLPYNGNCYFFSKDKLSWEESRSNCKSRQVDLVIIADRPEQVFIRNTSKLDHHWIGLTDPDQKKNWTWVNGSRLQQQETFWNINQPDHYEGKEHCATVGSLEQSGYPNNWNDDKCETEYKFICEKEAEDRMIDFTP